jgi:hypothetical protein
MDWKKKRLPDFDKTSSWWSGNPWGQAPKTLLKNVIFHSIILSYRKMSGEKAG